jgi:restriction system protein
LVAQCKKYSKPVGNKAVQEVVAGMKYYGANKGAVISTSGFTPSARKLASANNIALIHHSEIKNL